MKVSSIASFAVGVQTLRANPLRTVLSTLGIIIGVASLVAILALGDGLERFSREQIETTTDLQAIQIQPRTVDMSDGVMVRRDSFPVVRTDDVAALNAALEPRALGRLELGGALMLRLPDDTARHAVLVTAAHPITAAHAPDSIIAGRFFGNAEAAAGARVVVVGRKLAEDLMGSADALVSRAVLLGEQRYTVTGVVSGGAERRAARAWVPLTDETRALLSDGGRRAPSLLVRVNRIEDVPAVEADARAWLERRFGNAERDFTIQTQRARVDQVRQGMLVFKLAMGAITSISILVGGIGIMNVLLASVHERTREIGVRRAAGARKGDIFLQFIAESVAVSGVGSLIGVVLGLAGAFVITALIRRFTEAPVYAAFTWTTVACAAAAALFVGIAFGSYPARHAAGLSPIDAIRHE